MKLHRAFRYVEPRGNLLIREPLENALEHILLAVADLHSRAKRASRGEELLDPFGNHIQQTVFGDHHQLIIFRCMAPHQTMNREQTGNLFDGHAPVGFSLHTKSHRS